MRAAVITASLVLAIAFQTHPASGQDWTAVEIKAIPLSEKIMDAIGAITERPVDLLLNTHWHGDHTGGNANFQGAGALIFAHDKVRTVRLEQ